MFRIRVESTVKVDRRKARLNKERLQQRKEQVGSNPRMVSIIPYGLGNGKNTDFGKLPKGDRPAPRKSRTEMHEDRMKYDERYRLKEQRSRLIAEGVSFKEPKPVPTTARTLSQGLADNSKLAMLKLQMQMERLSEDINGLLVLAEC